jgi:ribosomal protein S18 acetylase RimI-like enzyme
MDSDAIGLAALGIQVWLDTYATDGVSQSIAEYVLSEFTPEKFRALLSRQDSVVLVAELGGNLVGYAVMGLSAISACTGSTVELATLYVQEHFTRAGVGSALLSECQNIAFQNADSRIIWLTVNAQNERAIAFYRKHGFVESGIDYFELGGQQHKNYVFVGPEG